MILTTLLAAAGLFGGPTAVLVPGNTSEVTAEGVEILRRILADSIDQAFSKKEKEKEKESKKEREEAPMVEEYRSLHRLNGLVTTLWTAGETVQHSRAFHMPDVGVFLTLDAALPVVTREPGPETGNKNKEDKVKDDEWERTRREVRTGSGTGLQLRTTGRVLFAGGDKEFEIDPKAVERTVETVLRTLGRHAARIEGLAPQESITVALRLSGKDEARWSFDEGPFWNGREDEENGEDEDKEPRPALSYVISTNHEMREENLVIRVMLGDLVNYGDDGYERLRQRAQINRY